MSFVYMNHLSKHKLYIQLKVAIKDIRHDIVYICIRTRYMSDCIRIQINSVTIKVSHSQW